MHKSRDRLSQAAAEFRFIELFVTHQAFPRGEGGPPERSEDTAGRMRDGVQSDIE